MYMKKTHEVIKAIKKELGEVDFVYEHISLPNEDLKVSFKYNGSHIVFFDTFKGYAQGFKIKDPLGELKSYDEIDSLIEDVKTGFKKAA